LEKEETGDLNTSSLKSVRTALTGVIGEAIDIGASAAFGEATKVDKEEKDSQLDDIEPC
tara:strand:- start:185 stop:361 length:177 start_codon:yes stop_codon:yes gene_type:complete